MTIRLLTEPLMVRLPPGGTQTTVLEPEKEPVLVSQVAIENPGKSRSALAIISSRSVENTGIGTSGSGSLAAHVPAPPVLHSVPAALATRPAFNFPGWMSISPPDQKLISYVP